MSEAIGLQAMPSPAQERNKSSSQLVFSILSAVFILAVGLVVIQNLDISTPFNFLTLTVPSIPLGLLLAIVSVTMTAGVSFKLWDIILRKTLSQYQASRKMEKLEVSAESSGERVRALEQKIVTLEKALQTALGNSSKF